MFQLPAMRVFAAGIIGLTLTMSVGCSNTSGDNKASGSSGSESNNDEQQIRDLYAQGNAAVEDFDIDKLKALTCAKYLPNLQANLDKTIPPMANFGSPEDLSTAGVDKITELLAKNFKPASDEAIRNVAQALVDNNEDAYHAAMVVVMREGTSKKLDKIENIQIKGDTATADTTTTETVFSEPTKTETEKSQAARENGQWKDCTPPKNG